MKWLTFSSLIYRWGDWGSWSLSTLLKVPQVTSGLHLNTGAQTPPWRRKWQLTPVFLPGRMGRGAWWALVHSVSESDMTEHTHRPRTPSPLSLSLYALLPHATCLFCLFVCLFVLDDRRSWLAIRILELKGIFQMICSNSLILWRRKPEAHRWLPDGSHWAAFHSFAFSAIS